MKDLFPALEDSALLWVWIASRSLEEPEKELLLQRLDAFTRAWTSHGRQVHGQTTIVENRVLLIAGEIPSGDISGCGIDKSVHVIEAAASEAGFHWLSGLEVAFRRAGRDVIEVADRQEFRRLAETGAVDREVLIYDRSPSTLGAIRAGELVRPASRTWTARYFPHAAAVDRS